MTSEPVAGSPVVPPKEVQTAFQLFAGVVVLGAINAVLSFLLAPSIIEEAVRTQRLPPGLTQDQLQTASMIGAIGGAVAGMVIVLILLPFMFRMRSGRNWARIVLTVIGAILIVSTVLGAGNLGRTFGLGLVGAASAILSIVVMLLLVGAIYFMFRPPANDYFRAGRKA